MPILEKMGFLLENGHERHFHQTAKDGCIAAITAAISGESLCELCEY